MVASLANFLLLARVLGPSDYGLVAAAWAAVLIVGPFAGLGSDRLVVRDVSAERRPVDVAWGTALATSTSGALVFGSVLVLAQPLLLPQVPLLLLGCLVFADIAMLGLSNCLLAVCFATERSKAAGILSTVLSLAKASAVLVFTLTGSDDPVRWALIYAGLSGLSSLGQLLWGISRFGRPTLRGWRLGKRAREGLPYSLGFAGSLVQKDIDKPLLVRNGYTEEAGLYSVAYRLASLAFLPVVAVQQAMFPRFFAAGGSEGLPGTVRLARRLLRPLLAYAALAGIGLVVVAPLIPVLVGEQFRGSVVLLMLLAPLPLFRVAQSVFADALTGAGMESTRTRCVGIAAAVNVVLNVALIPSLGLPAALLATFVSEVTFLLLIRRAVRRHQQSATA